MKNYFKKATSSGEEMHIKITIIENKEIQNTENVFNQNQSIKFDLSIYVQ